MDYPNCTNLELTINLLHSKPELYDIYSNHLEKHYPLNKFDKLNEELRMLIEDKFDEDFLKPEEGKIHFYDKIQRLPRLAEGEYEILVPKTKINIEDIEIIIPTTVVMYNHQRTYHEVARFDMELWKNHLKDNSYELSFGKVEELVNFELVTKDICSVYSTLTCSIDLPKKFKQIHDEFDHFYNSELNEYMRLRKMKINTAIKQGKIAINEIKKEDEQFYQKNKDIFTEVMKIQSIVAYQKNYSINELINTYFLKVYSLPLALQFKKNEFFSITSCQRTFGMNRINSSRDITVDDFKDSLRNTSVERIPFNQNFHDEFQNELLKNKDKKKDYESKAFHLLHEANNLINGGHYAAATLRASTALEVMLDGFLIESGIVTKKELDLEGHSLKYKMNDLFNKAVRNGKNHGKKYDLFDPRLKKKIIDIRKKPGNGIELEEISTLHNIRNTETHEGGTEKVNSNDYYLSKIAVSSYAEAVSYVINQGWNNNSKVNLQSEALTWVCRHLRDRVQQVPDNQVKDMLKRDLKKVFNYLQPMEIEKLNKQVDETSWAYEIFKKSK